MRRALILWLAAAALAAGCQEAKAQPVAKLEVVARQLTQHEKLDLLLRKADQLLDLHKAAPPAPPPVKPADPPPAPPVTPPAPAADNPFVAWCADGNTIPQFIFARNGGMGLSPAQEAQARAAGCFATPTTPAPGPGPAATGNDLSDTAPHYFTFVEGVPQTFTCTIPAERKLDLTVFTSSGSSARGGTDSGPGFTNRAITASASSFTWKAINQVLPAGTYTYTVALTGISRGGADRFGLQCWHWATGA